MFSFIYGEGRAEPKLMTPNETQINAAWAQNHITATLQHLSP